MANFSRLVAVQVQLLIRWKYDENAGKWGATKDGSDPPAVRLLSLAMIIYSLAARQQQMALCSM